MDEELWENIKTSTTQTFIWCCVCICFLILVNVAFYFFVRSEYQDGIISSFFRIIVSALMTYKALRNVKIEVK